MGNILDDDINWWKFMSRLQRQKPDGVSGFRFLISRVKIYNLLLGLSYSDRFALNFLNNRPRTFTHENRHKIPWSTDFSYMKTFICRFQTWLESFEWFRIVRHLCSWYWLITIWLYLCLRKFFFLLIYITYVKIYIFYLFIYYCLKSKNGRIYILFLNYAMLVKFLD